MSEEVAANVAIEALRRSAAGEGAWKLVRFPTTTGDLGGIVAIPEADWPALSDDAHVITIVLIQRYPGGEANE